MTLGEKSLAAPENRTCVTISVVSVVRRLCFEKADFFLYNESDENLSMIKGKPAGFYLD